MAEIIQDNVQNDNLSPNIDAELDAALNKFTSSNGDQPHGEVKEPTPPEKPQDVPENKPVEKQVAEPERKPKVEEKKVEEKPLPTSEEIEKIDPKDKGAWGALKNANKRAYSTIQEKENEINKLKATLAEKSSSSQKELDAIRTEKSELEKYRAMIDIQADPEFISKYDQPIEKAVTGIKDMIKGLGVTQATVDAIDFKDPKKLENVIDLISQNADRFTASKIERKVKEYLELSDKRDETLLDQQKNFKETLEKKKQESFAKQSESEGRMIKHIEAKAAEKDEKGNFRIPFLSKMEIKDGLTQPEIDRINNHNGLVDVMSKKLQEVMKMTEPEQKAEVAIAAVASHWLMNQLKVTTEALKKANEQIQGISAINSEAPSRKPASAPRNGDNEIVDTDKALSTFFRGRK